MRETNKDAFLMALKKAVLDVLSDPAANRRDKNNAIATGAKILQIEHRINPGDEGNFFE